MYEIHDFLYYFFFFCCSYRAGVTMSLLYIDSVFSQAFAHAAIQQSQRYFCQTITAKVSRTIIQEFHTQSAQLWTFFPSFSTLFNTLFPLKLGWKRKLLLVKIKKKERKKNSNNKKALYEQFYIHYYSVYFLLWLLHFS